MTATVVVCGLLHESNAFAGDITPLDAFVRFGPRQLRSLDAGSGTEIGGAAGRLRERDAEVVATTLAWARSSGPVSAAAGEALVAELADGVAPAATEDRIDGVVVCLHGSMCAVDDHDVEGRALARVREVVGSDVPVVATLDWHASVTERMVTAADAIVGYRTYPHIDQAARGADAADLVLTLAAAGNATHASHRHPPLLLAGPRTRHDAPAMAAILRRAAELGTDDAILTWSVLPGFARSDNPSTGAHVYALATDAATAEAFTAEIASALWDARHDLLPDTVALSPDLVAGVDADGPPLVLSDQGDNPGGGAAGDGTALLGLFERHGPPGAVVAALYDPAAVDACHAAGTRATLDLALGGHTDGRFSSPIPARVTVEALADGAYTMRSPTHPNVPVRIGPVARVRTATGTIVVLTSSRVQNEDLELLAHVGVDPAAAPVIAVKSNAHFRAAYEPIAGAVIDVDTPGLSTPHLERLPYAAVPRPIFPLDRDFDWSPLP